MKKVFEMPEVTVAMFAEEDILTLSPSDEGEFPSVPW